MFQVFCWPNLFILWLLGNKYVCVCVCVFSTALPIFLSHWDVFAHIELIEQQWQKYRKTVFQKSPIHAQNCSLSLFQSIFLSLSNTHTNTDSHTLTLNNPRKLLPVVWLWKHQKETSFLFEITFRHI
jgi:hypothetical protein